MNESAFVRPRIRVLTDGEKEQVHEFSLRILASTGVRVDSERARELFVRVASRTAVDGDRVRIPVELVEWALDKAPSTVDIYDRRGQSVFCLGEGRTRFGIGVTCLYYQDPGTDEVVPFARKHMENMVRLGSMLPNYDVVSTIGIIQDMSPAEADLYAALEMIANTTKPLVVLVSDESLFPDVLDLLEHLSGDLASKPFVVPYFNPVTPLVINQGTSDKMFEAIERGLPLIYSNYSMAGLSAPITPAGSLALLNAELLAGLTLSQLIKEGAPVILGSLPNFFDMKTMVNFFDPLSFVLDLACAEMMAYYHLPHCGTSGSGNGWGPDLIAADSYWMNELTSCLGKVGLAPFIGDSLGSKAFSPLCVVYVNEVIEQALRFAEGFQLKEELVGLDEIEKVGPGGNYLASSLTMRHIRHAYRESRIFPRMSLETWQARGSPKAIDLLREYTRHLLDSLVAPDDHPELMARGEAFIEGLMARRQ